MFVLMDGDFKVGIMTPISLYLVLGSLATSVLSAPDVFTRDGIIFGTTLPAHQTNKPFYAYYGIPFAKPPVGDLRFKPPLPFHGSDPGTYINNDYYRPTCIQMTPLIPFNMSEDCLYLNVFTPAVDGDVFNTKAGKKVIVYLHGGGFTSGDSISYPPSNWVTDFDVIVVVPTYRVGPFGFLSSGDDALPGNIGLLDQITSLYWLKKNIKKFGGDPDDITIYGTSSGAASASLLSISPLTKGLFTKVVTDGGNALAPWAINTKYEEIFYRLADKAHCLTFDVDSRKKRRKKYMTPTQYHSKIVDCLREVDALELAALLAQESTSSQEDALSMEGYISFAPVVDGFVVPRDPFELMNDPSYLAEVGVLDRTHVLGVANNEAMLFVFQSLVTRVTSLESLVNPDDPVAQEIILNNVRTVLSCPPSQEILHMASFLYFYPRDVNGHSNLQSSVNFMSDVDFIIPAVEFARALVQASPEVDVFMYLFDHYPQVTVPGFPFRGSTHSLSFIYAFDTSSPMIPLVFYANVTSTAEDNFPLFNIVRGMLSNLAKDGVPSLPGTVEWPKYDRAREHYMSISPKPELRRRFFKRRVSLWTDFLPTVFHAHFTRGSGRAPFPM